MQKQKPHQLTPTRTPMGRALTALRYGTLPHRTPSQSLCPSLTATGVILLRPKSDPNTSQS